MEVIWSLDNIETICLVGYISHNSNNIWRIILITVNEKNGVCPEENHKKNKILY
jgi:hypothetical protein